MKAVDIEFGSRRGQRRVEFWGLAVGLLIFALALAAHWRLERLDREWTARAGEATGRSRELFSASSQASGGTSPRFERAKGELLVPWDDLFASVEESRTDAIMLLSIEPNQSEHSVRVVAQATSYEEGVGFLQRLSKSPLLEQVALTSHESVNAANPTGPTRVTIQARWGAR